MANRVLIVDDEIRILQSLYGLLSENFSFELYRASSAREAMKRLTEMQFDLVITDISMPEMTGLELLKEIKRMWPKIHVLLLTAYSSFDYAYEAGKYDRVEYLLKIESYGTIVHTVRKTMESIELERAQDMHRLQDEISLRTMRKGMAQYLIRTCVIQGQKLPDGFDFSDIELQPQRSSVLIRIAQPFDAPEISIGDTLQDRLREKGMQLFSLSLQTDQLILLQCKGTEYSEDLCISAVREELEYMIQNLEPRLSIVLVQCFMPWIRLAAAYHRAGTAMHDLYGESGIVLLNEEDIAANTEKAESILSMDDINALFVLSRSATSDHFLQSFSDKLSEVHAENTEDRNAAAFLLEQIAHTFRKTHADIFRTLADAGIEWPSAAFQIAQTLCDVREQSHRHAVNRQIQQINRYVCEHLAEDLTLTTLAAFIHYNPSYLSRIYKQQTGMNLMNYVNQMRMKRACELLARTNKKVGQIATECGICSTKYFNELFRRSFGIAPLEYREAHKTDMTEFK